MLPSAKRRGGARGEGQGPSSWQGWQLEQRDDLTLSEVRHILWERRLLVAGCMLLLLAVAFLYILTREPVYRAEATLSVRSEAEIGPVRNFDEVLARLQESGSRGLVEEAAERAGWEVGEFNEQLEGPEWANNGQVKVRFSARDPEEAAEAANAYAEVFVERIEMFEGRLAGGTVALTAEIEEPAEPPQGKMASRVLLALAAAGGAGLLVGGTGALLLESRARRWSGSTDAERTLRAPVLGVIPDFSNEPSEPSPSKSEEAE